MRKLNKIITPTLIASQSFYNEHIIPVVSVVYLLLLITSHKREHIPVLSPRKLEANKVS
jgi:hypothetical protein